MENAKDLLFADEARYKLLEGIDQLTNVLSPTLGPRGRNIGIDKLYGPPLITSRGASVVSGFELKDSFVDMGASLARDALLNMREKTGDGTTTCLVLIQALVEEGIKKIVAGSSPIELVRGLEKGLKTILKEINEQKIPVENIEDIKKVATLCSNAEVGKYISEAFEKVGTLGVVQIEEAKGCDCSIITTEGMQLEKGFISSHFVTDQERMQIVMENASILICDQKIQSVQDILPLLQEFVGSGKELFIVAEDIEQDVLSALAINHMKGLVKVCAIKAPGFGDEKRKLLEDLAIFTGGYVINQEVGRKLKDVTLDGLGSCEKIVVTSDKSIFIAGKGEKQAIQKRVKEIEAQINIDEDNRVKLSKRKANLNGLVAEILVGAYSDIELEYKKKLFEDTLESTKVAITDGICVGGGICLHQASFKLKGQNEGEEVLRYALSAPIKKLAENSGICPAIVLDKIGKNRENFGFNVITEEVENLLDNGIVDPVKLVKLSLTTAVSVAKIILLTETLICDAEN